MNKMKIFLKFLIFFFPVFLHSQDLQIDKLLLTKKYTKSTVAGSTLYKNAFSEKYLISKVSDSVIVYSTSKSVDVYLIDKEVGGCSIFNFNKKDYLEIIDKLNFLIQQGYNVFKDDDDNRSDYKNYLEFISRGLIITTVPNKNQVILIYMNTCVFQDNENKLIKNIKKIDYFSSSYVFNCGGKQVFQKIK
ncbi:hypothetical protein EYY60_03030 [Flavobacterium zhairuonense]|uniref:hypothetical protein n=1 Tax=Flavobacterium zhairuonense TaxID=2493631 RepID=UPI00104D6F17|nr:hypothetical protein [Flavobacterium zhairuonense]KAF2515046.1 hypothetical protein EYY60_03030 [Flavobacterium zhairuonense]